MNSTTSRGEPLRSRYGEHLIDQQVNLVAEHATECPNLASIPAGKMLLGLLSDTLMFHR